MNEQYKYEYVNCEISEIIDMVENESLSTEHLTYLLNSMDNKIKNQDKIIKMQEMRICELSNNLTAIRKWGVKAPCFDENGEYIEVEIPNLFKEEEGEK